MTASLFRAPLLLVLLATLMQGCSVLHLKQTLPYGVLDNDDLQLVGKGLPTYMLMVDGMIDNWPHSESLLQSGANLYSAYAGIYVKDDKRAKKLTDKALSYAFRAACVHDDALCHPRKIPTPKLRKILARMDKSDVPVLFTLGSTWAGYIQRNSSDWNAIADLSRVRAVMDRIVAVDQNYKRGEAHMYLGVLDSILPASMGGKPEQAKEQFQKAVKLSDGRNLLAKMLYAKRYARLVFNRKLHDRLLREVIKADPHVHGMTLQNVYAQQQAKKLLASADDYF